MVGRFEVAEGETWMRKKILALAAAVALGTATMAPARSHSGTAAAVVGMAAVGPHMAERTLAAELNFGGWQATFRRSRVAGGIRLAEAGRNAAVGVRGYG